MALPFPSFPSWPWRNPASPPPSSSPDAAASAAPSLDLDLDPVAYPSRGNASFNRSGTSFQSASRRPHSGRHRRWPKHRRQSRSLDPDFDIVLVPPDGGIYLSGSDSDDSNWSIGWFEPHAPDFYSGDDDEAENSFAVLVPCYGSPSPDTFGGRGRFMAGQEDNNSKSQLWAAVLSNIAKESQAESRQYIQQWLSSLEG